MAGAENTSWPKAGSRPKPTYQQRSGESLRRSGEASSGANHRNLKRAAVS